MSTRLLIRHGESQANAGLSTLHPGSVELTMLGHEQAKRIAPFLETLASPDLIINSSYKRSRQTAEPTLFRFPEVPNAVWSVQEFTYISSWHNEPSTMEDRRPMVETYWSMADPTLVEGPESESFEHFITRVYQTIKLLMYKSENTIAVFSHEQFICALLWLLQNKQLKRKPDQEDMRNFKRFHLSNKVPNGAIIRLELDDNYEWRIHETITSHLNGLGDKIKCRPHEVIMPYVEELQEVPAVDDAKHTAKSPARGDFVSMSGRSPLR